MRTNPERTAWVVLLGAFFTCCALSTSIPLSLRWWLLNAAQDHNITMSTSAGTVLVTRPGHTVPEVDVQDIPVGSLIVTKDADTQARLTFTLPHNPAALASITIYGNTQVQILQANSPSYSTGTIPHSILLVVEHGHIQAELAQASPDRPTQLEVHSATNAVTIVNTPGSRISIEVTDDQTIIEAREGQAQVGPLTLSRQARAAVTAAGLTTLPAENSLIADENFLQPLDTLWKLDTPQQSSPNDQPGVISIQAGANKSELHFVRQGADHGQIGVTQAINQDVRNLKTLRLRLAVQVTQQDVWNCGSMGTECPAMVSIKYVDTQGRDQSWLKGFYYLFNPNLGPTSCPSCGAVSSDHTQIVAGQWYFYTSNNLLTSFQTADAPAYLIKSITLYAAGHSFESTITNVELLGME